MESGSATRRATRKVKVEPPAEWGRDWSWNVTEDGTGIYFERTATMNLDTETKVINTQDGEPGLVLDRYSPDAYEVMTDHGIEVWQESDILAVISHGDK